MTNQLKWDKKFLEITNSMAKMSKCQSKKVCAIAVMNNRIIATGLNGTLPGYQNCTDKFHHAITDENREEHHQWSLLYEAHAEDNLISEFSKNHISSIGSTIYINIQPCMKCTIRLANIGIHRIVYSAIYDKANTEYSKEIFSHSNILFDYIKI